MRMTSFGAILCGVTLTFATAIAASRAGTSQSPQGEEPVPAYHDGAPKGSLPETLNPSQFTNIVVQNAYTLAARVKKVLYQQPCYCHCDRSQGHGSLLDCFAGKHASVCEICIREGLYSYEQSHKGKTGAEIRAGIERGEWRQVDVSKYVAPVAVQ